MMGPAEVHMARWLVVCSLGLLVMLGPPLAWADGKGEPPAPTAAQRRADPSRAAWREAGLAAIPEVIAALCSRSESLIKVAADELARHGAAAMPQLIRAAPPPRCQVEAVMATIMCAGAIIEDGDKGQRQWEEAVAALLAMAGSPERATSFRGINVLSAMAFRYSRQNCPAGDVVFARAMPVLAARLRAEPSGQIVPSIAESVGSIAAPLVPDLIPLLDKGEPNTTARALGAIGPKAAPAVPALRAILRRRSHARSTVVRALGGIGEPAGPAVADFAPLLKQALPDLCHLQPRVSDDDMLTWEIADAAGRIGGPAIAPLFPELVAAYRLLRGCRMLGHGSWSRLFAAAGKSGPAVAPTLLAVALDPDEALTIRRTALASLDQVGAPREARGRLASLRAALARKEILFRPGDTGPEPQVRAPPRAPPSPDAPPAVRAFDLCRMEAGLRGRDAPASVAPVDSGVSHVEFITCVEDRLCGPDEVTYRATMSVCCRPYGAERPWFCEASTPP
jgi:HEAT repeat protein